MIVFLCVLLDMHGNHHHHHHQRTDLSGIMSITSVYTIGPLFCALPLQNPKYASDVKQNDGTWVEKHQRFLFNVYKRFFIFVTFFYVFKVFLFFFLERFFTSMVFTIG